MPCSHGPPTTMPSLHGCKHRPGPGNLWSCPYCGKECCQACIGWRASWRWCHECHQAWVSSNAVGTRTVAERAQASSQDITGFQASQRNGFQPYIVLSEWTAPMIIHCLGCHPLPWSYTRHFGRDNLRLLCKCPPRRLVRRGIVPGTCMRSMHGDASFDGLLQAPARSGASVQWSFLANLVRRGASFAPTSPSSSYNTHSKCSRI